MNAAADQTDCIGQELTINQRHVLRKALRAVRLIRCNRGVVTVNELRQASNDSFPVRTIKALERSGYLQVAPDGDGWLLTPSGAFVGAMR